jgi:hypothetical protein
MALTTGILQDEVMDILLRAVHTEAELSMEPILILIATLARDLQHDYLVFIPRILSTLTQVIEQGAQPTLLFS